MWTFDPLEVGIIPPAWRTVIETVRLYYPNAVIAGGALRDLGLGGEVRDLDVFTPLATSSTDDAFHETVTEHGWGLTGGFISSRDGYAMSVRAEVTGCRSYVFPWLAVPVQIITTALPDTPEFPLALLKTMDFDLCRVAHTGSYPVFENSLMDAKPNTMTLVHCPDEVQAARSVKRAEKFADRYPGMVLDLSLAGKVSKAPVFCEFGI